MRAERRDVRLGGYVLGGIVGGYLAPSELSTVGLLFGALLGASLAEGLFYLLILLWALRQARDWRVLTSSWFARDRALAILLGVLSGAALGGGLYWLLSRGAEPRLAIVGAIAGAACLGTLGSVYAWTIRYDAIRQVTTSQQRLFAGFLLVMQAALALFLLQVALFWLQAHPTERQLVQAGIGVVAFFLTDTKQIQRLLRYALSLEPRGLLLGFLLGAFLGALTGGVVSAGSGAVFPLATVGFALLAGGSYGAMEGAEYVFARRHAPSSLEASRRALLVRLVVTFGGLGLGMLLGGHWANPWTMIFLGAGGATVAFWIVTLAQGVRDNMRQAQATERDVNPTPLLGPEAASDATRLEG
jgi:hypothetical protein